MDNTTPLTSFERQRSRSIAFHRGIGIDIREEAHAIIVTQTHVTDGHIRTNQELYDIGRRWYPDRERPITPVVYRLSLADITPEWVNDQVKAHKLSRSTLKAQTGLTASELSDMLNGRRPMTRTTRAMFYYFFLTYQLNRDLRQPPISAEELAEAIQKVQAEREAKADHEAEA